MLPLSSVLPKPALPLLNEPVAASPIRLARSWGAAHVVVNTWHLAAKMEASLTGVDAGRDVVFSRETELMGTAGGLALARDRGLLGSDGPVLVINGDGYLNLDLCPLVERMESQADLISLALLPHLDPHRWSRVHLDRAGLVTEILPPGPPAPGEVPLLYPGVMLVARKILDALATRPGSTPDLLWKPALKAGRLGGVVVSGHWREIGTPGDYLKAVLDRLHGDTSIHPTAAVDPDASIRRSLIGRNVVIDARAVISESVVIEGATVAADARVHRSIVMGAAAVARGDRLSDVVRAVPTANPDDS